jgi:ligand-binding SRPBCC domain-containing protein
MTEIPKVVWVNGDEAVTAEEFDATVAELGIDPAEAVPAMIEEGWHRYVLDEAVQ